MSEQQEKVRPVLAMPIYVLVEEDALILPNAKVQVVTPSQLPQEGNYYVLTADGLRVNKDTSIVKALAPVKTVPVLASFSQASKLRLPKVPPVILARFHAFAALVWDKYKAECEVMLLYNQQEKRYDLWCPQQTVTGGGVDYTMSEELANTPADWQWVGTIHSHCNFNAYHSGTDIGDEEDMDGLHITVGHVDTDTPSISSTICIGGERHELSPEKCCLGLERADESKKFYVSTKTDNHFSITLSEEEESLLSGPYSKQIRQEWMPRVQQGFHSRSHSGTVWTRGDVIEDEEDGEWRLYQGSWTFFTLEELQELDGLFDEDDEDDFGSGVESADSTEPFVSEPPPSVETATAAAEQSEPTEFESPAAGSQTTESAEIPQSDEEEKPDASES